MTHGLGGLEPRRLVGRGAGDEARRLDRLAVAVDHGGDAERRPVVGRAGGDLHVGALLRALRGHVHLGDQLVLLQHGLVIAGEQVLDRELALALRPDDRQRRAERHQHRRQVHVRIAVRQRAADGRDIAHAHVRQRQHACG